MKEIHAYMYVSCKNRALTYLEWGTGFKNKREIATDNVADLLNGNDSGDETIINEIVRNEYFLELYNQVDKLPPQRRQVIQLHFIEGHSLKEVAQMMNMSRALVTTVKSKALAQLRTFYSAKEC